MSKRDNLTGRVYGDLEVLRYDGYRNNRTYWITRCKCGREAPVSSTSMKSGSVKSCLPCSGRKHQQTTLNRAYLSHKRSALDRGMEPLPRSEWDRIIVQKCHYCGKRETRNAIKSVRNSNPRLKVAVKDDYLWDVQMVGVDRKDPSKEYSVDNCLPCCSLCNQIKMDLTYDEFKTHIAEIYTHFVRPED